MSAPQQINNSVRSDHNGKSKYQIAVGEVISIADVRLIQSSNPVP